MLKQLLRQLHHYAIDVTFDINIWIDAPADGSQISLRVHDDLEGIRLFCAGAHRGKEGYWMTINDILLRAESSQWHYLLMLQDDIELGEFFLGNAIKAWRSIEHPAVLNLFTDPTRAGRSIWGQPMPEKLDDLGLWKCNWTDPMFFTDRRALEAIGFYMNPITGHSPAMGSKVGIQLSKRFNAAGVNIYQGIETFVHHGDHPSMMNPELRKQRPLVA